MAVSDLADEFQIIEQRSFAWPNDSDCLVALRSLASARLKRPVACTSLATRSSGLGNVSELRPTPCHWR